MFIILQLINGARWHLFGVFLSLKVVEAGGVEPPSWRNAMWTSTCLFRYCCLSSRRRADGQACIVTILPEILPDAERQNIRARALLTSLSLSTRQGKDVVVN